MLQEKQYYLEQLKDGPLNHRKIMNRMLDKFNVSASKVRDDLINEGYIVMTSSKRIGTTQKIDYFYKLTDKRLPKPKVVETTLIEDCWPDGWPKSRNNAFNWRTGQKSMFSKKEIADSTNKGKPANYNPHPVSAFTRA